MISTDCPPMRSFWAFIKSSTSSRTTTWFSRLAAITRALLPSSGSIETRSLGASDSPRLCMRSRMSDSSLGAISRAEPVSSVSTSISTAEFIGVSASRATRSSIERRSSGLAATSSELVRGSVMTSGFCRRATSAGKIRVAPFHHAIHRVGDSIKATPDDRHHLDVGHASDRIDIKIGSQPFDHFEGVIAGCHHERVRSVVGHDHGLFEIRGLRLDLPHPLQPGVHEPLHHRRQTSSA